MGGLVREQAARPGGGCMKILLPVDGSECSDAAVQELIRRSWPSGTQVEVLSVAQPTPEYPDTQLMGRSIHLESVERETKRAQENVDEAAATIRQGAPLVSVTTQVVEGSAKEEIVREASTWGADLIVMGSHGYGAAMRFLMGSVSLSVMLHAPCSVEIVRSQGTVKAGKS